MINGKILKKSLSLLLTVLMLASVCAVCFGTFATAYMTGETPQGSALLLDFESGKGYAAYGALTTGEFASGIVQDPDDANNQVLKLTGGKSGFNWSPLASVASEDAADNFAFKPNTTYVISFKWKAEAGYSSGTSNGKITLFKGLPNNGSKAAMGFSTMLTVDATNGIEVAEGKYALEERSEWQYYKVEYKSPANLNGSDRLYFNCQASGYDVYNVYYFDDFKIDAVNEWVYECDGFDDATNNYWSPNNNSVFANSNNYTSGGIGSYVDAEGYHFIPSGGWTAGYNGIIKPGTDGNAKIMRIVEDNSTWTPITTKATNTYVVSVKYKINKISAGNKIQLGLLRSGGANGYVTLAAIGEFTTTTDWQYFHYTLNGADAANRNLLLAMACLNDNSTGVCETLIESIKVCEYATDSTIVPVKFVDRRGNVESYSTYNTGEQIIMPEAKGEGPYYWKDSKGNIYYPASLATISGEETFTAVYENHVFNFIGDKTGESAYAPPGNHNIFSNSNNGTSYLLKDASDKYTGGLHLNWTFARTDNDKAQWGHKFYVYDPDSDIVNTDNEYPGYVEIQKNYCYVVTVTYKATTATGSLGIGVGSADAPVNTGLTVLAKTNAFTAVDTQWKTFSYTIDGNAQANYTSNPDTATNEMKDLAGRYIAIIGATGKSSVDVKDVTVNVVPKTANQVLITESVQGVETIKAMTPNEKLLPAKISSLGEASMGWYADVDGDGKLESITTVPDKATTIYAKYPTLVYDFENSDHRYNPNNKTPGLTDLVYTDDKHGNALQFETVGGTECIVPTAFPGADGYGYKVEVGKKYQITFNLKVYDNVSSGRCDLSIWRKGTAGISTAGHHEGEEGDTRAELASDKIAQNTWTKLVINYDFSKYLSGDNGICGDRANDNADKCAAEYMALSLTSTKTSIENANLGYTIRLIIDSMTIKEITDESELYAASVEDAKSSLRKKTAIKSAGLRFRGQVNADNAAESAVLGFITMPTQLIKDTDWYKITDENMSAEKGVLNSGAQYAKIVNHMDMDFYYAMTADEESIQYQLCITGMKDEYKSIDFTTVMFMGDGNGNYTYKYVNTTSYNTVKQVYTKYGYTGY